MDTNKQLNGGDAERQVASESIEPNEATTTITVELPVSFAEAFRALAERERLSESSLVVRSVGLYSLASQAESGGHGLTFTRIERTNDLAIKELIRIENEPASNLFIPGKR
jgi:hypothetical protein